ncbi:VapE family protein [Pseudomonas sp. CCI3.2]|uniref:VapE domain-containing protein n=1 Tax=unclassified Pseudomonas TaxID=196821 RepID=UPI002B229E4F|nr:MULTISPECIES: VapE domain-containing protein [unclassified Pseudomonas]MEB0076297.1 VapE family protein [Pseudomonas sp. MH10out]MEB0101064.1 VapE family protein [Pseudomonas sp. CCI3.2]MEB0128923.1 VapE family protein [Pseudomonas sp. CCI2.4]
MSVAAAQPLYGVELLNKHKDSQVIVVQGEAARGAAQRMFKEDGVEADKLVVIGWPGKIEDVDLFDWSVLAGRSVGIWPNAGSSPRDVAKRVVGKAESIKVFTLPTGVAPGWSLFDELPPGFNLLGHVKKHAAPYFDVFEQPAASLEVIVEPVADQSPDADHAASLSIDNAQCLADEFAKPDADLLQAWAMADLAVRAEQTPAKKANSTAAAQSAKAIEHITAGLGFLPLGVLGESYAFWRIDTRTVELIRVKEVGTDASILRLATRQAWEFWGEGQYDRAVIMNMLIQVSKNIGQADRSYVPEAVANATEVEAKYLGAMLCAKPSGGLLAQALGVNPEWRKAVWFDVFRNEVTIGETAPCGVSPGIWTDDHDPLLAAWAASQWFINVGAGMAAEAIMTLAQQDKRHPVRGYLQSLAWDGTPRLDSWLVDIAGCADDEYTRAVGAKTLIGAVARVMSPGCKLDTVLVLEGRQGLRKSSLIEALVPNLAWHSDSLGGEVGSKDAQVSLSGKWVIELGELANLRGADVSKIKHFVSDQTDSYRPPYGRRTRDFPRQCVFIGTINPEADGAYLHDYTGGRRFWPVACTKVDLDRMRAERDQLWAEAKVRYAQGETWWLTAQQDELASEAQSDRLEENPWVSRVVRYVNDLPPISDGGSWGGRRVTTLDVAFVSDIFQAFTGRAYLRRDLVEGKNIGSALRTIGWESKNDKVNGVKCRHWKRGHAPEVMYDPDDDAPPI